MLYYHVDVFSSQPLAGNGLTVVFPRESLTSEAMLKITQEFRQFETIFVFPEENGYFPVRIFTVEEELDFAGHPILGAAAVIHHIEDSGRSRDLKLKAGGRIISVKSVDMGDFYNLTMNQGKAAFIKTLEENDYKDILPALNISIDDLYPGYPLEVVSTGLPYLLLPLKNALDKVRITVPHFEEILSAVGAKFAYFFDPESMEARTWDNSGFVEDVATGSAAGPLCAYLVKNAIKSVNEKICIKQGRFVNRESQITGWITEKNEVLIEGDVVFFSSGDILTI
jgi:PhzF family phenazine biosynthesis protein